MSFYQFFRSLFTLWVLLLAGWNTSVNAKEIKVAVASNFYHSLQLLLAEQDTFDFEVRLSSGSTGMLYAQILHGAPFDVFLSADEKRADLLQKNKLGESSFVYAHGNLVLWPVNQTHANQVEKILSEHKGKLVIANPKLAPFGLAAQQVLSELNLEKSYQGRLIKANNVNQAFQFIDSGNAPLSLIALSQLTQAQRVSDSALYQAYLNIPADLFEPIKQKSILLTNSKNKQQAKKFLDWLKSEPIQQKIANLGYGVSS